MTLKLFELRDRATFIPIFAFRCRPASYAEGGGAPNTPPDFPSHQRYIAEKYLLARAGFDLGGQDDHVIIGRIDCETPGCSQCTYDMHSHTGSPRTFYVAHQYIEANWEKLETGAVIDVEFILHETTAAKVSKRISHPE